MEAPEPDDVDVQAPPGRQVPQRRPVHLGGCQVEHRAHLRSRREDHGGHRAHHHRPDRGAGPLHAGRPHQEAGPAPARAARLLRWTDRAEEVRGVRGQRDVQCQARRHGTGPLRVLGEGRQGGPRRQSRLLGRQDRRRPLDHAAHSRDGAARGGVAQGRGRHHHAASTRPGRPGQRQCLDPRHRRSLRRPLRPRGEQQAAAARQPARQAGAVTRHRPRGHREGAVAGTWDRPQRTHRQGRQSLRPEPAAARLQPERGARAAQEGRLQGRGDLPRDHRGLCLAGQGDGRGGRSHVEGRGGERQGGGDGVLGARPEEPREVLQGVVVVGSDVDPRRPRRHDVAASRPRRADGLLARRQVRRAGQRRALFRGRKVPRRGLPGHHEDFPREPPVGPGHPAV